MKMYFFNNEKLQFIYLAVKELSQILGEIDLLIRGGIAQSLQPDHDLHCLLKGQLVNCIAAKGLESR